MAPSWIRRRASPRLRQPQTKGIWKSFLLMWFTWSAGDRTSDSSAMSTPMASKICASTKWPIRTLAMTGIFTASMISQIICGSEDRLTPPAARMSAGTLSRAITAAAPAASAIFACSTLMTSMMTPPLRLSAKFLLKFFICNPP